MVGFIRVLTIFLHIGCGSRIHLVSFSVCLCVFRMAAGVEEAVVICPFMTPAYQASRGGKKELNYADTREVIIVPVMLANNWEASEWLGLITAGLLWVDFR